MGPWISCNGRAFGFAEGVALGQKRAVLSVRLPLFALLFVLTTSAIAAQKVSCSFDAQGLDSLGYGETQFLKSSSLGICNVFFADDKGADVPADRDKPTISFEPAAHRLSYSWPWGAIRCRYEPMADRLNLELSVENDTAGPMSGVEINLLELKFPRRPNGVGWEKRFEMMSDNEDDITARVADYGSGMLTFCNDDPTADIRAGAAPPNETWLLKVTSPLFNGERKVFVPPRSAKTFHFSIRFSEPGTPLKTITSDIIEKFVAAHPFQLKWPDRRPIGMLSLASGAHSSPGNPRGWFGEPQDNFMGMSGIKRFREKMLETTDRAIVILKEMGAQGVIFWDMEGEQYPNINYIGDPRMTAQLAPEMEQVAPEVFERFHKAGLRTGVCIRPSRIVPGWDGHSKYQHSHMGFDVVEEMNQKIIYAKKHLGCLLFYVDSNVRYFFKPDKSVDSRLLEAAAFKHLADLHPDILLIPELPQLGYWSCTAPYQELRPHTFGNHAATDPRVLDFYPHAFSLIKPIDGPAKERRADLVAGQRRGDMLLFRCWFADEQNKLFKSILDEADRK
jgi:hypothetical protein